MSTYHVIRRRHSRQRLSYVHCAVNKANGLWSWSFQGGTGKPKAGWSDSGGALWELDATEAYCMCAVTTGSMVTIAAYIGLRAEHQQRTFVKRPAAQMFAFMAILHNDINYARRARDMLLHVVNQALANNATQGPFASNSFSTYDRSRYLATCNSCYQYQRTWARCKVWPRLRICRWWGEGFGLTYDWLQYWPSLLTTAGVSSMPTFSQVLPLVGWQPSSSVMQRTNRHQMCKRRQGGDPASLPVLVQPAANGVHVAARQPVQHPCPPPVRPQLDQQLQLGPLPAAYLLCSKVC
jgi:hypothetical protein